MRYSLCITVCVSHSSPVVLLLMLTSFAPGLLATKERQEERLPSCRRRPSAADKFHAGQFRLYVSEHGDMRDAAAVQGYQSGRNIAHWATL